MAAEVTMSPGTKMAFSREDLPFDSHGTRCQGWLYRPADPAPAACVILGHGFGATRECGLAPYAEAFAGAGYAAFVFDYRHFGASGGEPRQLLVPARQTEDWLAALAFVRGLPGIRSDAVALWGTSMAGGLVTIAAARDGRVQALVAQCPLMDGVAAIAQGRRYAGLGMLARVTGHALYDLGRAALGLEPHRIPSAAHPGEIAAMSSEDAYDGYMALVPEGVRTDVAARVLAALPRHRPIRYADRVGCPALIQICERDSVAPPGAAADAAARMPRAEVRRYDIGHFEIYRGPHRDRSIADQLAFLRAHVPARA